MPCPTGWRWTCRHSWVRPRPKLRFTRKGGQNTVTFRIEERDEAGQIANYLEFIATGAVADKVEALQWKPVKVKASLKVQRSKDAAPVHKYEVLDIVEA